MASHPTGALPKFTRALAQRCPTPPQTYFLNDRRRAGPWRATPRARSSKPPDPNPALHKAAADLFLERTAKSGAMARRPLGVLRNGPCPGPAVPKAAAALLLERAAKSGAMASRPPARSPKPPDPWSGGAQRRRSFSS